MTKLANRTEPPPGQEADGSLADLVLDALSVGAASLDHDGHYVEVNDIWAKTLGAEKAADLIGLSHFDICQNFLNKSDLEVLAAGTSIRDELADLGSLQDEKNIMRWSAAPLSQPGLCCVVIIRKIAPSTEEETGRLLRERDQLRFAVDGADYGLWDWDVATGEVYFSRQYMKMLGYEQFELPHSYDTWSILCNPDDVIDYEQGVEDYVAMGDGFLEDEFQMVRKDGSLIWILSRGKIVSRRRDGSPLRIVGTHQDIGVQKAREEQLVLAKDEADQANAAKSDFLALISHEVRTPLNGITSVLELLGDEEDAGERKRLSQIALNSSDQLLTVLSDVLDVSKMEAGRFDIHPKPVKLADLIEELSQTHKKATEAKGLKFSLSTNSDPDLFLMMDPVRVTQILNNFRSNATKFTEQGGVALRAEVDETYGVAGTGKVFISFAVRDDGLGLTPAERRKLFQPFYQAEGTRSRSSEGTGLGLSICKKLAGLMDGKVWCASKKGFGSTFYFEAVYDRAQTESETVVSEQKAVTDLVAKDIRVLAAEDNPVNQMMLKKFLTDRFGYQLSLVSDGQQAIDALVEAAADTSGANGFDLILMDIHMPVLDGVSASRKIRASKNDWCNIPIIALTADAAAAHVEEYKQVGIQACAAKPINWQDLDHLIKSTVLTDRKNGGA